MSEVTPERIDIPVGMDLDASFWTTVCDYIERHEMRLAFRHSANEEWAVLDPSAAPSLDAPLQLLGLHDVRPQTPVQFRLDHAFVELTELPEPGKYPSFPSRLRTAIEEAFFGPRESVDIRPPVQVAIFVVELKKEITPREIVAAATAAMPELSHAPLELDEDTTDWGPFSMHERVEVGANVECERFHDEEEGRIYVHFRFFVDTSLFDVSPDTVENVEAAAGRLTAELGDRADALLINVVRPSRPPGRPSA